MEPVRRPSAPVSNLIDADIVDGELNSKLARSYDAGYEEGASTAAAALFVGLFIGAGSTALWIWLAMFVL